MTPRKPRWLKALGLVLLIATVAVVAVSADATVLFEDDFDGSIDSTTWPFNTNDNFTYDDGKSHADDGTGSARAKGDSIENEIQSEAFDTSNCVGQRGKFVVQFYYKLAGTKNSTDIHVLYGSDGTDACYGAEGAHDCLDPTGGSWALYKDVIIESRWKQEDFRIGFNADLDTDSDKFWVDDFAIYCCSDTEVCGNGLDDDCDCDIDCDDDDCPQPGAEEICDNDIDDDCDNLIDEDDPDCSPVGGATEPPMLGPVPAWAPLALAIALGGASLALKHYVGRIC